MKSSMLIRGIMILFLFAQGRAHAEDIDLFVGAPPAATTDLPNVLLIVDNTGNWNTAFNNEKAALVNTLTNLPVDRFNVGLMMFGQPDSGYVRAALRTMDATNRPLYVDLINSMDVGGDRESARTLARTISEAHRYLSSAQSVGGASHPKRDYWNNNTGTAQSQAIYDLTGNALANAAATQYISNVDPASCGGTYIIYIGNTVPSGNVVTDNTARNTAAGNELNAAGGDTTQITLPYTSHQNNYADEWARFLHEDMGVVFYTVDVDPTPMPGGHNRGMGNSALLRSMAEVSNGRYFRVNSAVGGGAEIAEALDNIFSEILSVNTVFASVSLPASANTQSTFLNQVFIGMFRPDGTALPKWPGNLKQYKLGLDGGDIKLLDAADTAAINQQTGFITECARSFWTPSTVDSYWGFNPQGSCIAVANSNSSNSPDGPLVEKGAQGYKLRGLTPNLRTVRTCSPTFGSCTSLTNFGTANAAISASLLGAPAAERDTLINWMRGQDLEDENGNSVLAAEMRASAHGDVVHSRPVAINYGADNAPQVVVFYSGNDGMLRAINGNRDGGLAVGGFNPGEEMWSFVPPEFYGKIKRLYDNTMQVSFPTLVGGEPKPYAIDGPITAFQGQVSGSDVVYVYAGMRRGGRALYSFNVTNPASPTLKWKRGCPNLDNDTDCSTGWSGIGQTWSPATPIRAAGHGSGTAPLLITGGGYDDCEDYDADVSGGANHLCSATKGNRVFVIDGDTGDLLRSFTTERGVVGSITVVPDASGLARYAYAADLGGNIYRISGADAYSAISTTAPASWTITRIASLGCDAANVSCTANRKFLFGPDVVESGGGFSLLLGSGDREKPLLDEYPAANSVSNYFFMVQDRPTQANWLTSEAGTCGVSMLCLDSLALAPMSGDVDPTELAAGKGWYLELASTEQVVTSAITVTNRVTFSTFQPSTGPAPGACTGNLGTANVYNVNYANARPIVGEDRFARITGDGLPPSPVAGNVILDDGTIVPFLIGGSPISPLEAMDPSTTAEWEQPKSRVYWQIQK
jgi:type IV pilus assembly protein PilY1